MRTAAAASAMVVAVLLATFGASASAVPAPALMLRRSAPLTGLERLHKLDRARFAKRSGVGEFALLGFPGVYYTNVKLGNPSKEYSLQFDTGSDLMWVSCSSCTSCPATTNLGIPLDFYSPNSSSTSSNISCSDDRCKDAIKEGHSVCQTLDSPKINQCGYDVAYAEADTSGYYVSDTMHFDTMMVKGNEQAASSSTSVIFGCSYSRSSNLLTDGIVGFGKNAPSVILQLNSLGVSPKVFSHCLTSSDDGGGIVVLDEVVMPGFVFTPLVPSQPRYNLNMMSIYVKGKKISIDSSLFTTSNTQGTMVDSGTSLSYLADGIYDPVISAIDQAVPYTIRSFVMSGSRCYVSSISNISLFPTVTFYFEGGAPMIVGPRNYLILKGYFVNNNSLLCIGFLRSKELDGYRQTTILGDLVLRDKLFVYYLDDMRLGWVNQNCSLLNKTTTIVNNTSNTGATPVSGFPRRHVPSYCGGWIATGVVLFSINVIAWGRGQCGCNLQG